MALPVAPPSREPRDRATAVTTYFPLDTSLYSDRPERWAFAGVGFVPFGCNFDVAKMGVNTCNDTVIETVGPQGFPAEVVFPPFRFKAAVTCSALGLELEELHKQLDILWAAEISPIIAEQVMAGVWNSSAPSLVTEADNVTQAGMDTPREAVGAVEDGLAALLRGAVGMIHMPPSVFFQVRPDLEFDGVRYRTPSGHYVVADAGYQGDSYGSGATTAGESWVYGSSIVHFAYLTPDWSGEDWENFKRSHNDNIVRRDGIAIAIFEPCSVVAAKVDYVP